MLTACAQRTTPPTVVVVSSITAAGPALGDEPRREDELPRPVSNYGRSKRAGERVCEAFSTRLPITIVRPPIVFGEGDPAMLALFRPIMRHGVHLSPGLQPRRASLIHVADLVELLCQAAERGDRLLVDAQGEARLPAGYFYAADDVRPTYVELGQLIAQASGRQSVRVLRTPDTLAWCFGLGSELWSRLRRKPAIVNLDKIREAVAGSWICSSDRAREQLGFQVARPLVERLRQTAESYIASGWVA